MRNFHKLAEGMEVKLLTHALHRQPDLWNQERLRTTHPLTPHKEVDDILVRFQAAANWRHLDGDDAKMALPILNDQESVWWPAAQRLPQVRPLIFTLAHAVEAERVGRVIITRMKPGSRIAPHVDGGEHAAYYERYHVVLQGLPGSLFTCGDETVCMTTGSVWWFNNAVEHHVVNNSSDDRLHMIVDLRCLR